MKTDEKKQSVSPLAILAFGLVIVAIVSFAVFGRKETAQTNSEKSQQPAQQEKNSTEKIIPEPAVPTASTQEEDFRLPPYHQNVDAIQLPPIKDPSTVSADARPAYVVAQSKPKLIAQMPCFCYCDRWGHGSLHDCFVSDHAVTCDICMKTALQADQMDRQGIAPGDIREAIIAQFQPHDHNH